jgi:hypothetical protein
VVRRGATETIEGTHDGHERTRKCEKDLAARVVGVEYDMRGRKYKGII